MRTFLTGPPEIINPLIHLSGSCHWPELTFCHPQPPLNGYLILKLKLCFTFVFIYTIAVDMTGCCDFKIRGFGVSPRQSSLF